MKTPDTTAPLGKGLLRCFCCREPRLLKEGDWRNFRNQQVFLCKVCARLPEPELSKSLGQLK